jgi:L-asparagine oxygenase
MLEFNLKNSLTTFNFEEYMYEKEYRGGEKEYILKYLLNQPWIQAVINFFHSNEKILLIRGCPIDKNLPLSPIENGYMDPIHYELVRDFILTLHKIMNLVAYSYQDENEGKLFRSLVPVKAHLDTIGSYGSKNEFKLHSDNPTYKLYPEYTKGSLNAPEFLSLFCIRGQNNVNTRIVDLTQIITKLNQDTVNILKENIFTVNTPNSFDKYHEVHNVPVITEYKHKMYTRFDYHNIKANSAIGKQALDLFTEKLYEVDSLAHTFESGDFLIFKNQEVLHSRDAFESKFDGNDRWLLRVYGATNIGYLENKEIKYEEIKCI